MIAKFDFEAGESAGAFFSKNAEKARVAACLAGTNPGTSGAFCGANPKFCESED